MSMLSYESLLVLTPGRVVRHTEVNIPKVRYVIISQYIEKYIIEKIRIPLSFPKSIVISLIHSLLTYQPTEYVQNSIYWSIRKDHSIKEDKIKYLHGTELLSAAHISL